jgi:hypothetical protein
MIVTRRAVELPCCFKRAASAFRGVGRMSTVTRLLGVALVMLLPACAQPVAPERASAIKTVGIIVAMRDEIHLTTIGHIVFQNQDTIESVPTWDLDDSMRDKFGAQLGKRYDVRPVTADKAAFAPGKVYYPMTTNLFTANALPSPIEAIRASASPQGLDAYLIVTPSGTLYGTTNVVVPGVGLLKGTAPFFSRAYYVHALYRVLVIDGHDGKVIGDVNVVREGFMQTMRGPNREVDASWWADTLDEMSPQQRERLQSAVKEVIDQSVPATLRALKLIE